MKKKFNSYDEKIEYLKKEFTIFFNSFLNKKIAGYTLEKMIFDDTLTTKEKCYLLEKYYCSFEKGYLIFSSKLYKNDLMEFIKSDKIVKKINGRSRLSYYVKLIEVYNALSSKCNVFEFCTSLDEMLIYK